MYKIAILANSNSIHIYQWAHELSNAGVEVHLFSLHSSSFIYSPSIYVTELPFSGIFGYVANQLFLRNILAELRPNLLHAHYATGYGTLARLCAFHPLLLSVWGSDVLVFPTRSFLHRYIVSLNLLAADALCSTSVYMAKSVRLLTPNVQNVFITPFGVDSYKFSSIECNNESRCGSNLFVIGTVRSLEYVYGIDLVIKSFAILIELLDSCNSFYLESVRLHIVGDGSDRKALMNLASSLGILNKVQFLGSVAHDQIPKVLSKMDIFCALSRSESFGVAVIEASSMGLPVVVSDVGGLREVVINRHTGLVVPSNNPSEAAKAYLELILNPSLRSSLGEQGKDFTKRRFSWRACVENMLRVYDNVIS